MKPLIVFFCVAVISTTAVAQGLKPDTKTGNSGTTYTFFKKQGYKLEFTDKRPDIADASVMLCIPAAFTNVGNNRVDGIYAVSGTIAHPVVINKTLGGICYIEKGNCRIFQSAQGRLFGDSLYHAAKMAKASFFQQIQCIEHGKAAGFKDKKLFQRRGIAILKDHSIAVIESQEPITLKVFAEDLVELGVMELIYTDMGAWDEGWYRPTEKASPKTLGTDLSQTARQSNWVIYRK